MCASELPEDLSFSKPRLERRHSDISLTFFYVAKYVCVHRFLFGIITL